MQPPNLQLTKVKPLSLSEDDQQKLVELESRVENSMMDFCVSLAEIRDYKEGIFWTDRYQFFPDYVKSRFGYGEQHAGRLVAAGKFVRALEQANSAAPKPIRESQIRPILNKLPEGRHVECWELLTKDKEAQAIPKISADIVEAKVVEFRKTIPKAELDELKRPRKEKANAVPSVERARVHSRTLVGKLLNTTGKLPKAAKIKGLLEKISELIAQDQ